jgi:hypothetical protein
MASDYIAAHITQLNSGTCARTNCWCAVGAYLVDSGTRGRKRPTPAQFRKKAGVTTCRTGGLGDIIRGCKAYGVKATMLAKRNRKELRWRFSRNKSEKVYALAFDFDAWPISKQCVRYSGYHAVAVVPGINKRKSVRTMDPLCRKLRWVLRGSIIDAAQEYAREHGHKNVDLIAVNVPRK